jgi:hypothetical protein
MRLWINKTFSTIGSVLHQLAQSPQLGELTLICTHTHPAASAFLNAHESYLEPTNVSAEEYVQWCLQFCQQQRVTIFWAGKEAALISQQRDLFAAIGTQVLAVADYHTLQLLSDKARFYSELPPHVASIMDFAIADNAENFEKAISHLSLRHQHLCVKPSQSVFGLGFRVLDEQRDSVQHLTLGVEYHIPLAELRLAMSGHSEQFENPLLVMEYLGKNEWSVDCVAQNGNLLCAVQRKKPLKAGHGQLIDNNLEIAGMVQRLAEHYRLNGLFNAQFREGEYGVRLLEINARPSGGVGMACLAGVNLPALAVQSFLNQELTVPAIAYGLKVTEVNTAVVLNS